MNESLRAAAFASPISGHSSLTILSYFHQFESKSKNIIFYFGLRRLRPDRHDGGALENGQEWSSSAVAARIRKLAPSPESAFTRERWWYEPREPGLLNSRNRWPKT
jgi:hypothetical protein